MKVFISLLFIISSLFFTSNNCSSPYECSIDFEVFSKLNYRESSISQEHSNSVLFKVNPNQLPKARPISLKQRPTYRYFWNFDDGNFFLTEKYDASILHTYRETGNYNVYVEASATKTEDDDVYRTNFPVNIITPLTSKRSNKSWKVNINKALEMLDTRNPKVGKPITYIIGYVNRCDEISSGKVHFEYDINDFNPSEEYVYHNDFLSDNNLTGSKRKLTFDFNNLKPNEQRNLFVELIVKNDTDGKKAVVNAKIEGACKDEEESIICKKIGEPDDPNNKYWDFMGNDLCEDSIDVEIGLKFKNQGNAPTNFVRVLDIFDKDIIVNSIDWNGTKAFPHGSTILGNSIKGTTGNLSLLNNIATFKFNQMRLRGEKEAGYKTTFQDIDTKDSIKITANITIIRPPECGVIQNNLEIYFDTLAAVKDTVYRCYNCKDNCGSNQLINLPLFDENIVCIEEGSSIDLIPNLSNLGFTPNIFLWNKNLPVTQNVTVNPLLTTKYHLCAMACIDGVNYIASDDVTVKVEKCKLEESDFTCIINHTTCPENADGTIQITGDPAVQYNFVWEDIIDNTNSRSNLLSGEYFVKIEGESGCILEKNIFVEEYIPLYIDYYFDVNCEENNEEQCSIITQVSGGTGDYIYEWSNGESTPNLINPTIGNHQLLVTDANNCEVIKLFIQFS